MTILELVGKRDSFVPSSVDEYFALQLAKRLGDAENAHQYVRYTSSCNHERLLVMYQEAISSSPENASARFHSSFTNLEP